MTQKRNKTNLHQQLYEQVQPFLTIFIVSSILIGVWSLQITSRMIAKHLPEHKIMHKYAAIQLVLILYKLQPTLMHGICSAVEMNTSHRIASKCIENGKRTETFFRILEI